MAGPSHPTRPGRRSQRGLVIEGEIVARSGPAPVAPTGAEALRGLDLAARAGTRPYQSLLDDAMRLARRCGPAGGAPLRLLTGTF